ncbi:DUF1014-domain-containing protein [Polyplosphaeria fusca]|uniref:DUF1014-domain-containing protein n=1 Tax=Polyplosphaeria fusca TaxID=682080 RepID=A0A9P4QVX7_9PLEO|nr:DUF1014-domain-containing protein [Polyplosphaeria fusca]
MPPKKGENSKKAAGQTRKADAAASKQAAKDRQAEEEESSKWSKGAKSNAKAEAAAAKAAEAARKKAEKDALLREEEASLPSKPKGNAKKAEKKTNNRGIDSAFSSLDAPTPSSALNATGIDNALDALSLTSASTDKVDRHPERRFKAAYAVFEERRLDELKDEKGLRRQQKIDMIRKEFEKHPDNPFNQVSAAYNSTRADIAGIREGEKVRKEANLGK